MAGEGTKESGTDDMVGLNGDMEKRVAKPTIKGLEHNLQTKITSRRAILGRLTEKRNELHALMDDDANVNHIENELLGKYERLLKEFSQVNVHVKDLFCQIGCEENMITDQKDWFEPRNSEHINFTQEVKKWIQAAKLRQEEAKKFSDEIQPDECVSHIEETQKI